MSKAEEVTAQTPKKYHVLRDGYIAGQRCKADDVIELTDGGAKYALLTGAVEPASQPKSKSVKADA